MFCICWGAGRILPAPGLEEMKTTEESQTLKLQDSDHVLVPLELRIKQALFRGGFQLSI
jgi:hypothetical protein